LAHIAEGNAGPQRDAEVMPPARLKLPPTLAFVLAGGRVGELSVLTSLRPKAAVPFGGIYRIVDFALSNLSQAGISRVGILAQYRPGSLIDHVGNGTSWDLFGPGRCIKILPPYEAGEDTRWYLGNADAVRQNLDFVRDYAPELVLVVSGDHLYHMDYQELLRAHLDRGADVTVAFRPMGGAKDPRFGYGVLDEEGWLLRYEEKPQEPPSDLASLTIYVFPRRLLEETLREMPQTHLEFGRDVIPWLLQRRRRILGWIFRGYWGYCRTPEAYLEAHQDLLRGELDPEAWGVRTNLYDQGLGRTGPSLVEGNGSLRNSLAADGCRIAGEVADSVLGPRVRVEAGAVVHQSVVLHDAVIGRGAVVQRSILDKRARVGSEARVGAAGQVPPALLGKNARVEPGAEVPAGASLGPDEVVGRGS
jgi:glucose-1-phosphate adenylyltransferase